MDEKYLGDGVYVSFDGYQLRLRASREDRDDEIYLEPAVYEALTDFVRNLRADLEKSVQAAKDAPHA